MVFSFGNKLAGLVVRDQVFQTQCPLPMLQNLTYDPRDFKKKGAVMPPHVMALHEDLQRPLMHQKLRNMKEMSEYYIPHMLSRTSQGFWHLPDITVYSSRTLEIETVPGYEGLGIANVPERMIAIDGETQLAAWYQYGEDLMRNGQTVPSEWRISLCIVHGIESVDALQIFHDLNTKSVALPASMAKMKDTRNPIGRFMRTQVSKWRALNTHISPDLIYTLGCAVCGGRPYISNKRLDISDDQFNANRHALIEFCSLLEAQLSTPEQIDMAKDSMLFTHLILGVMGAELHDDPAVTIGRIKDVIYEVDWKRGEHWVGRGVNHKNPKSGSYPLSGATGAAVSMAKAALFASGSEDWRVIRQLTA